MEPKNQDNSDAWQGLRRFTPARIALGRAGGSLPTGKLLDFRLAHARAVDAVSRPFDPEKFCRQLSLDTICLSSAAPDHRKYLQRPDLGRTLSDQSRQSLESWAACSSGFDLVIIICDGLSALAVERQVPSILGHLLPLLGEAWSLAPLMIVRHGRVALQDQIGELVRAAIALTFIGERPGLNSPDSLGAYLVHAPKPGSTDACRNCVSNIRPEGLDPSIAADRIYWLLSEIRRRQKSGVELKDESGVAAKLPLHVPRTLA